jgi:uncharacterized DUF497 family protein
MLKASCGFTRLKTSKMFLPKVGFNWGYEYYVCPHDRRLFLHIHDFEWDEGNALHLQLGHGITPEEAEEVFANKPFFRRTKKGHYAVFGPTFEGRYLTIVFDLKAKDIARPFTGWDMARKELQYYKKHRRQI